MDILGDIKQQLIDSIAACGDYSVVPDMIEIPPKPEMGDFAVQLFAIAKKAGKPAPELALELADKVKPTGLIKETKAVGPYLNFYTNTGALAEHVLSGDQTLVTGAAGKKVNVEYFSPNTNKPMTLGHLRTLTLGSTYARLLEKTGHEVVRSILFNDRGIAIAKSMVAYDLFGDGKTPESEGIKPDQFVGNFYVQFGRESEKDESLEQKALEYLRRWEDGDGEILAKWKQMNAWVHDGYGQTLAELNEDLFDIRYFESDIYEKGREIIESHVGLGVIKRGDEGEVYADLEDKGMPNKILTRSDGTSLYITSDIQLAYIKNQNPVDELVYVIGDEQNLQMQQLFAILETLPDLPKNFYHFSYGMMRLPDGKIKSREGFSKALADALIGQLKELALKEIEERNPDMSDETKHTIAKQLMQGALKYYILAVDPAKAMVFDPEQAISFTGNTGPYLQYTVVRLNAIKVKAGEAAGTCDCRLLTEPREHQLILKLAQYTHVIEQATNRHMPSLLAHYMFELAQETNAYYADVPVLKAEDGVKEARLALIQSISETMTEGLALFGIEVPEKM